MTNHDLQYTLRTLFSGDRKIIIPDMQREYCWATTISEHNGINLVSNFIEGILKNINSPVRLGLIYGYENPKNYLQLCDGQQRLTTLYLLCGVLYRLLPETSEQKSNLHDILISEAEIADDHEPRLQYAIRESTLFFLRDLVWNYFLQKEGECSAGSKCIMSQNWFFSDYSLDPSINNILNAIDTISDTLTLNRIDSKNMEDIAKHIVNIEFLFFDMQNRKYGEEQFVVLNTTGKPLTITENIKPLLLGGMRGDDLKRYSQMWEKWEQYFWEMRHKTHLTSDIGLNELFRWFYILQDTKLHPSLENEKLTGAQKALKRGFFDLFHLGHETTAQIMDHIDRYFQAVKELENNLNVKKFLFSKERLTEIECFQFLPILQYYIEFNPDPNDRSIERVINFFKFRAMDDDIRKTTITSVINAIKIIFYLAEKKECDLAQIVNNNGRISSQILNKEEFFLFSYLLKTTEREKAEDLIWKTKNLDFCSGSVAVLLDCLNVQIESNELDFDKFLYLKEIIELTFEKPTDTLRRALLAIGDYTQYSGETPVLGAHRYSLGCTAKEFGIWAKKAEAQVIKRFLKGFLDLTNTKIDDINKYMNEKIKDFKPVCTSAWENARTEIILRDDIISQMNEKLFAITYDEGTVFALRNIKATDSNSYFLISKTTP